MDITKTVSKKVESDVRKNLKNEFNNALNEIKQIIIEEYDDKLMGATAHSKSLIDYNMYREEFISRLNDFQFIKENGNVITLDIPDIETFDFSDGLEIVQTIMEGLSGVYVEVNEKEYSYIFGRKPRLVEAVDKRVSPKDRVFLVRYTGSVRNTEKELSKHFVRYPFSNTPPIDILEAGNLFVNDNLNVWVNNAIERSNKEVVTSYK